MLKTNCDSYDPDLKSKCKALETSLCEFGICRFYKTPEQADKDRNATIKKLKSKGLMSDHRKVNGQTIMTTYTLMNI